MRADPPPQLELPFPTTITDVERPTAVTGQVALVRRPGERLAEGIVTHMPRREVDIGLARRQWQRYVDLLAASGWAPLVVPPADESADAVFVEDTMVLYRDLALIGRPGPTARRVELDGAERAIADLGYRIERITPPGTLDGGDVLRVGRTVYVGVGGRTNAEAVSQLRGLVESLGGDVAPVGVRGVLHLKTALGALPNGSLAGYLPSIREPERLPGLIGVPEPSGAQVVTLDERRLLLADDCPRSAEVYVDLGFTPITVAIGEFQKLEGAVTCLSVLADQRFT